MADWMPYLTSALEEKDKEREVEIRQKDKKREDKVVTDRQKNREKQKRDSRIR